MLKLLQYCNYIVIYSHANKAYVVVVGFPVQFFNSYYKGPVIIYLLGGGAAEDFGVGSLDL